MNGPNENYVNSNETAAKVIAYLSPYLFWGTVGLICGSIWLLR